MQANLAGAEEDSSRRMGILGACTSNMLNMVGIGPFTTIPLILTAMGGPQALLGWICGAIIALADGLVWAELGAAMPDTGGSYEYLQKAFGPSVKIGVISVPDPDYDPKHWWRYSEGVREVLGESIAYIYARIFFHPSKNLPG